MVELDKEIFRTAANLSEERGLDKNDVMHALLAKKAGAVYLVTRNMKDFENPS